MIEMLTLILMSALSGCDPGELANDRLFGPEADSPEEVEQPTPAITCRGKKVAIGAIDDNSGTSPPDQDVTGAGGVVCSASCRDAWIDVWISDDLLCSSRLALPATVPIAGLHVCYELTDVPPVGWSATCEILASGRPSAPFSVVW